MLTFFHPASAQRTPSKEDNKALIFDSLPVFQVVIRASTISYKRVFSSSSAATDLLYWARFSLAEGPAGRVTFGRTTGVEDRNGARWTGVFPRDKGVEEDRLIDVDWVDCIPSADSQRRFASREGVPPIPASTATFHISNASEYFSNISKAMARRITPFPQISLKFFAPSISLTISPSPLPGPTSLMRSSQSRIAAFASPSLIFVMARLERITIR